MGTRWTTRCCSALALTVTCLCSPAARLVRAQSTAQPAKPSSAKPSPLSPYPAELRWTLALNNALVAQPAYDGSNGYFPIQGDRVAAYDLLQGTQRWMVSGSTAVCAGRRRRSAVPRADREPFRAAREGWSVAWTVPSQRSSPSRSSGTTAGWLRARRPRFFRSGPRTACCSGAVTSARSRSARRRSAAIGVYVPMADGRVIALHADTGEILWERRLPEAPNDILVPIRSSSSDRTTTICTV